MDSTSGNWNPKWRGQEQRTRCRRLWQTRVQPNHVPCSDVTPEALLISKRPHKQCCVSPPRLWADWKTKEWLAEDKISAFCEAKLKDRTLWWEQRESATWAWEWVRHRHGLHWVRADLPRTQEVCTYSLREFSPPGERYGRYGRRQSKPDILLEFPYQSRVSKTFRDLRCDTMQLPPTGRKREKCSTSVPISGVLRKLPVSCKISLATVQYSLPSCS